MSYHTPRPSPLQRHVIIIRRLLCRLTVVNGRSTRWPRNNDLCPAFLKRCLFIPVHSRCGEDRTDRRWIRLLGILLDLNQDLFRRTGHGGGGGSMPRRKPSTGCSTCCLLCWSLSWKLRCRLNTTKHWRFVSFLITG